MGVSSSESSEQFERRDPLSQEDMEWYGEEEVDAEACDDFEVVDELEPEEETNDGTPSEEGTWRTWLVCVWRVSVGRTLATFFKKGCLRS